MKVKIGKYPKKGNRRKINLHIDPWDTWNMDHTLATIIYPMLLQLRASKNGVPGEIVADVGGENYVAQDSFDFYKETHNDAFDKATKRWDEVLDKMIWSFQQLTIVDYNSKYFHGVGNWDFVETNKQYPNPVTGKLEPTYQMVDKNPESHWFDAEGLQLHEDRIQEGLDLFAKYYRSLWD